MEDDMNEYQIESLLARVMNSIDSTVSLLKQMDNNDILDQWTSYLLESIDTEIGEDALKTIYTQLDERFNEGNW
jgi:uncharacterized protein YjgD (DUF1641 family)